MDLFSRKDYGGTSIGEITARANITKGALYYYFKDKNEVFMTVCQMAMDAYQREVFDRSASREPSESGIRALIKNGHDFDVKNRRYSRLYLKIMGEDWSANQDLYPVFRQYLEGYRERVRQLVLEDQAHGHIQHEDADAAAALVMSLLDGLSIRNTIDPYCPLEDAGVDAISDLVLKGLN